MLETEELARPATFEREVCRSTRLVFNRSGKFYQSVEKTECRSSQRWEVFSHLIEKQKPRGRLLSWSLPWVGSPYSGLNEVHYDASILAEKHLQRNHARAPARLPQSLCTVHKKLHELK